MTEIIEKKITLAFSTRLVTCIREALEEDLAQFKQGVKLATSNGLPFLKGDFINTRLQSEMSGNGVEIIPFTRYGWASRLIVDRDNKVVVNIMSKSRIQQLMKDEPAPIPHYVRLLSYILNGETRAPYKQVSLFDNSYSKDVMDYNFDKIFSGQLSKDEGYTSCVLTYELREGKVYSCDLFVLDGDLDIVEKKSLSELLEPDFVSLTEKNIASNNNEIKMPRVNIKTNKKDANASLITLRKDEKQA